MVEGYVSHPDKSRPTWARGLKHPMRIQRKPTDVAPHVGAWIETLLLMVNVMPMHVAPHVGAWIETFQS